ncbi:MAG: alkaline phosphatase family protein, partial [Gammaproteobacteria bacterium]
MSIIKFVASIACVAFAFSVNACAAGRTPPATATTPTATPIRYLVVIFQENVSFDHYFATYPKALNPPGEPAFHALPGTPSVNGLTPYLLHHNPNRLANGKPANPHRLDRSQAFTCDQDHGYTAEQKAYNGGLMNRFVPYTSRDHCKPPHYSAPGLAMDYFDGNTVTALWNYAQHYAMSDNNYGTTFGPSTPGAMNLIAGQTHGMTPPNFKEYVAHGTLISDLDPAFDDCSNPHRQHLTMHGRNIGDLLNAAGITWGWFQAGFRPDSRTADGKAVCSAMTKNIAGVSVPTYIPHHEPFQFYHQTSNPHHFPPKSVANIGHAGP